MTGMHFQASRRQLRLTEGLAALTRGEPLASAAAAVGYSSSPVFGAAFRNALIRKERSKLVCRTNPGVFSNSIQEFCTPQRLSIGCRPCEKRTIGRDRDRRRCRPLGTFLHHPVSCHRPQYRKVFITAIDGLTRWCATPAAGNPAHIPGERLASSVTRVGRPSTTQMNSSCAVTMQQSRLGTGLQRREIHTEVSQAEDVSQHTLFTSLDTRAEGLRVTRRLLRNRHPGSEY